MTERRIRLGLAVLVASGASQGLWALLAPRSFYDDFPLPGRLWVAADGPFNEHLVRDVGGLALALGVVAALAWARPEPDRVRTAAVAWLIVGVPHLAYHVVNPSGEDPVLGGLTILVVQVAVPLLLLLSPRRVPATAAEAENGRPRDGASRGLP